MRGRAIWATGRGHLPPLRRVVETFCGPVMRRTRAGETYQGNGYADVLECGHLFVPMKTREFTMTADHIKLLRRMCVGWQDSNWKMQLPAK